MTRIPKIEAAVLFHNAVSELVQAYGNQLTALSEELAGALAKVAQLQRDIVESRSQVEFFRGQLEIAQKKNEARESCISNLEQELADARRRLER